MSEGVWTIIVCGATLVLMAVAFKYAHIRKFHVPVMASLIIFDLAMPIYLFLNRDMHDRLIVNGDIFTFGVWMHFMVIIVLYVLYAFQVITAMALVKNQDQDGTRRTEHRNQAKAILLTRFFVIFTGALLYEPQAVQS